MYSYNKSVDLTSVGICTEFLMEEILRDSWP